MKNSQPGANISFGTYPQTVEGTDQTPIQWRILEATPQYLFLLSEFILDCKRYHSNTATTAWSDCDLRRWLNREFYNTAFNSDEKDQLLITHCTANGANSPETEDRVFLLSIAEVKAFTDTGDDEKRRRTTGTAFAKLKKADQCNLYVYDKEVEKDYILTNGQKHGCSWWWTRTQMLSTDNSSFRIAFIGPRSNIKTYGQPDIARYGVRPAIRIKYN